MKAKRRSKILLSSLTGQLSGAKGSDVMRLTFKERINLGIYINDLLDRSNIVHGNDLTNVAIEIHDIVENAIEDYSDDNDFTDDYDPSY